MNRFSRLAIFFACIASFTSPSYAGVVASAYVSNEITPIPAPPTATSDVLATQTAGISNGFEYAYASANAATGELKTVAQAGLNGAYIYTADASASIAETLNFSGGYGQVAFLDWSYDGTITLAGSPYPNRAYSLFALSVTNVVNSSQDTFQMLSGTVGSCSIANCEEGTSANRSGTLELLLNEYDFNLNVGLIAFASFGNLVDFGNTATLSLRLPDGVTFTSTSGQFLSDAGPTNNVPEPVSLALIMGAFGALTLIRRRQSAQSASPA